MMTDDMNAEWAARSKAIRNDGCGIMEAQRIALNVMLEYRRASLVSFLEDQAEDRDCLSLPARTARVSGEMALILTALHTVARR